jgi:hypothetical protein
MLITPLPLNTRHAGPRQVAVGPGALRQLICDTTKVNTGAAETTRTDRHIDRIREEIAGLDAELADNAVPGPLAARLRQRRDSLTALVTQHDATATGGPAAGQEEPAP